MTTRGDRGAAAVYRTIGGKRVVVLDLAEYVRLKMEADEWEPPLPPANADGNYPALEYGRASLARAIIRDRRRLGWSQQDLAERAGVRLATVQRAESGTDRASHAAIVRIDRALEEAKAAHNGKRPSAAR